MTTALFTHYDCLDHVSPLGHPECAERLSVVLAALEGFDLKKINAEDATEEQIRLVHGRDHIDKIKNNIPDTGNAYIDGDTYLSSGSEKAALKAAGAVCQAIDMVMAGDADNAFCAVRPPGHHAEPDVAMGFCLYNAAAIGALYARNTHFCHRVAIIDFDVHHGNGTQTVAENTSRLFYGSTHQSPLYPGTGHLHDFGKGVIVNVPLAAGSGSNAFRRAYEARILPELDQFKPDLIIISAGFDAHMMDPLADLNLDEDDYYWVTKEIMKIADKHSNGRIISTLEGGYNLAILGECAKKHVSALMGD
ncbi:histone deacetylase family protein [Pseudemcibacter aquimaris]|uniref:histone deacetylase family protein n=1 Tax=Pseudemcibacter aquimaris TaxID=2857064 RepID=UPI002012AEBF|nr:histone deacetylase family protein [Pseudemcibacter aquimaris]MCC3861319.1 histone deacetylase family protein [Pseudemcibacter aquimaris]WDU58091.1 histone deacetylase family protein [Pseudemcibacter aquimaris]